ncbi:MAG: hypothetical protein ACPGRE_03395 [Flavobacteriaceae bacterium]
MLKGFFFIFFSVLSFFTEPGVINELRVNMGKDWSEQELEYCYDKLSEESDEPVNLAYLGVVEFMLSKNASFPIKKFKYFNKGKEHINDAILKDTKDIELRYLRFLFQTEIPKFLGYHDNKEEDLNIFIKYFHTSSIDMEFKNVMLSRLKSLTNLSEQELNSLNQINS